LVPEQFAFQTSWRCSECWQGESPLVALEVLHRGAKRTLRISKSKERARRPKRGSVKKNHHLVAHAARDVAMVRLTHIFHDVFAVIHDEERVKRGLHPLARYNPIDFEETVSKTLDFSDVYDALRSSGVTDGP
jgi:hypothetical protein